MLDDLLPLFRARFGRDPEWVVRAPGRVNLIGEHTDYSEGLVLPCAIDRATYAAAAPRGDARVRAVSAGFGEAEFDAAAPERRGDWADYVRGVFFAWAEGAGPAPGLDLAIASDVPAGAGLSSSAALEVAVACALREATGRALEGRELAALARRAETGFVGVQCGIMDQLASALGRAGHALRIDCRSLTAEAIPIAGGGAAFLLVDSGVRRQLAAGGYDRRVAECRAALHQARTRGVAPEVRALRDLAPADLPALERALDPVLFRRARHVVTENARVDRFAAALRGGDLAGAGALLREAMASLRGDFEVSAPELDRLCEIADAQPGCYGSRLTGAGWGGCTLHLVDPAAAASVAAALAGHRSWLVVPAAGAGPVYADSPEFPD